MIVHVFFVIAYRKKEKTRKKKQKKLDFISGIRLKFNFYLR